MHPLAGFALLKLGEVLFQSEDTSSSILTVNGVLRLEVEKRLLFTVMKFNSRLRNSKGRVKGFPWFIILALLGIAK
jgi:hypothetical protein